MRVHKSRWGNDLIYNFIKIISILLKMAPATEHNLIYVYKSLYDSSGAYPQSREKL